MNRIKQIMSKTICGRISLVFMLVFSTYTTSFAHGGGDFFQNIGKIYVVVGVVLATFIGIVFYLTYLSRKIKELENEIEN